MQLENEDSLKKEFKAETGKNAIWHGNLTKAFTQWKEKRIKAISKKIPTNTISEPTILNDIQSNIKLIFNRLINIENRLKTLENIGSNSETKKLSEPISEDHFWRILKIVYNSLEKKFGDFVSISALTENIKQYLPWSTEKIHLELYKLFIDYKIDLQPGKMVNGEPLKQDGKSFVWFKFK